MMLPPRLSEQLFRKSWSLATVQTAVFTVDGNTVQDTVDGISIVGSTDAYITNNTLQEISGVLLTVGTLTKAVLDGNTYNGSTPTTFARNTGTITSLVTGENLWPQYDSSITDIGNVAALPITSHYHTLSGTTTVTSATFVADVIGFVVVLEATATLTINDSATVILAGNFAMTDGDTLTLVWSGAAFTEVSRSNNA